MNTITWRQKTGALFMAAVMLVTVLLASWPAMPTQAADTGVLRGKSAVFFGDSIAYGYRDEVAGQGWSHRLQQTYGMVSTQKAVSGASYTVIANRNHIPTLIKNAGTGAYDYVILQGGFNDAMGQNSKPAPADTAAPIGTISDSYFLDDFDSTTFAGELEKAFYYIHQQYPTAKVGYIITYQTPHSEYGGVTADVAEMRKYWAIAKQICEKWDVQVLDLFDGTAPDGKHYSNDVLDMDNASTASVPGGSDHIHLSKAGYDAITPYIAQWMVGLTVPTVNAWSCSFEAPGYVYVDGNPMDLTAPGVEIPANNYAKLSSTQYHSGSYSMKMQSKGYPSVPNRAQTLLRDGSGNLIQITDRFKDYRISFWVRQAGDTAGNLRYYLALDNNDNSFTQADKDLCKLSENNKIVIEKDKWVRVTHVIPGRMLQQLPREYSYIRLGLTSDDTGDTKREFWIDDVEISQFGITGTTASYEQYAVGINVVGGNGSGREISATHAHGGNGADAPGQKAVRLKMNQVSDGIYARTVVQTAEGNHLQVVPGLPYRLSFWAYWAADEGSVGTTDALTVRFGGGVVGNPMLPTPDSMVATGNKSYADMQPNTWQRISFIVTPLDCPNASTNYLTLGAQFDGASPERTGYLYLDDVEVSLLSGWTGLQNVIEAPNGALLYNDGTNATYYSHSKGKECAALRIMGRYTAKQGAADVAYADGMPLTVLSRGILLGNGNATDGTLRLGGTGCLAKTEIVGDALSSYWAYENGQIVYTLLLKNIDFAKKDTAYSYRTFMKVDLGGEEVTVYSDIVKNLSAQNVYNGTRKPNGEPYVWFGGATGSAGDTGVTDNAVSLLTGFDSRFSIVYADGDEQAKATALELQKQLQRLLGGSKVVSCAADTTAAQLPYEILVGNTNRGQDDAVISAVAAADPQHDAAFAVQYTDKKVAIAAKNTGDATKYGIVLGFAMEYFLEQVTADLAVSVPLDFNSTDASVANGTGGAPGRVLTVNGLDLLFNNQIIVEKYPSYMVMEAARDLQRYLATATAEYVPIMKGSGHDSNDYSRIFVGPQQDAVRVHYAETAWGAPAGAVDPDKTGGVGSDDGAFDLTPTLKKGYVDTNQTDSKLLNDKPVEYYEISSSGRKVTVNGGSVYAVNAGVQNLIATLETNKKFDGSLNGNYDTDDLYSLSGDYGLTYEENFDFTNPDDLNAKYTVDKDTSAGPTPYTPKEGDTAFSGNNGSTADYFIKDGIASDNQYWDVQQRPATWGTDGTYYAQDGYLYEYTRKLDNGYSAVRVTTQNKMTYRYGFTEVRMVAGTDNGACSAIWAVSDGNPFAEFDVYENFGRDELRMTMHYWKNGESFGTHHVLPGSKTVYKSSDRLDAGDHFYDTFHHIGFEWNEYEVVYYVDGEAWLTVDISQPMYKGSEEWISKAGMEVFRQPIWIKLTNGVGGTDYTEGYNPIDYAKDDGTGAQGAYYTQRTDGKYDLNTVEDFCETQVVDYMYIFQKQGNGSQMNIKY